MKTPPASDIARPFYRSEAFPEDVADLVESATAIAARRQQRPAGHAKVWLWATLLPVGAVTLGVALLKRLF